MKDNETRDKFVELRAQGKSFAAIADELGVSKPTLIDWSRDMQVLIANLRAVHDEALLERYRLTKERQLQALSQQLEIVETEISKRGLSDIPTDKLYNILLRLTEHAREQSTPLKLQRNGLIMEDLETKMTWEG